MGSNSFLGFFRSRLNIAKQNPLFWYNLLLIVGTAVFIWYVPAPIVNKTPSDFRIRLWGMALQIIGALTVWYDLTESARKFDRPGFAANTISWLKRLVSPRVIASGSIVLPLEITVVGGTGTGRQAPPDEGASIEERVATLEYNLKQIDSDIERASQRMTTLEITISDKIQKEATLREISHNQLNQRLQDAIIGNYAYLVFGAVWVAVGIIISSLAPEIARVVAGQ